MSKDFSVNDLSGDKSYFTMVPNYVLNHSTAIDQAVYLQMKRYAGEKGEFSVSKRNLVKKLGIGWKALNKSIDYLVSREWISCCGLKEVKTPNGPQKIELYQVNDIWKLNTEHYDGAFLQKHGVHPKVQRVLSGVGGGCVPKRNKEEQEEEDIKKKDNFSNSLKNGEGIPEREAVKHLIKEMKNSIKIL